MNLVNISESRYKNRKPWERQKYEPDKAFYYFCIYKDMGADRNTTKVAQVLGTSNANYIGTLSGRWKWKERAREWDNEVQNAKNAAMLKQVEDMNKRHAQLAVAGLMPIANVIQKVSKEIEAQQLDNLEFNKLYDIYLDSIKAMSSVVNIERKARGEATEITKSEINSNEKVKIILPPRENEDDEKAVQAVVEDYEEDGETEDNVILLESENGENK